MKQACLAILFLSLFSCNSPAEPEVATSDSTTVMLPIQTSSPIVLSTEEKLSNSLQKFSKEKIDSIDGKDVLDVIKEVLDALNEESENGEWEKAKEYYEKAESTMNQTEKGTVIFNQNKSEFVKIKNKIESRRLEEIKAEKYLKQIGSESRWERLRKTFQKKLEGNGLSEFSNEQRNDFKQILADWDDYKENNKISWYRNGENNIEDMFFNYSKDNGKIKAAWGFMIQQVDWDGATNYFTNIAPDAKAMGKPYYMLKYYYNTIGKGSQFVALYDNATEGGVGIFCPKE